jgi:hypothetical protein
MQWLCSPEHSVIGPRRHAMTLFPWTFRIPVRFIPDFLFYDSVKMSRRLNFLYFIRDTTSWYLSRNKFIKKNFNVNVNNVMCPFSRHQCCSSGSIFGSFLFWSETDHDPYPRSQQLNLPQFTSLIKRVRFSSTFCEYIFFWFWNTKLLYCSLV